MDFSYSPKVIELRHRLLAFMEQHVIPAIPAWEREVAAGIYPPSMIEGLKEEAKAHELWNLFLPGLEEHEPGTRLSNMYYAPLAEVMGRVFWASELFNCSAPDTGNMELLHMFATAPQRERWLMPLLNGDIRSCFAMTEPDVASSDATNIATRIERDGDDYVITGRKWFITGAADPRCKLCICLGVSDPEGEPHARHSMVLVPMESRGLSVTRNLPIMHHTAPEGHCELVFDQVRVPAENLLGEEGKGFALAQARLGPGRIHHCMRSIGQCELALELMCKRAGEREAFGKKLHEHGTIAEWIALSRIEIDQARLLVLRAAWLIDKEGNRAARNDVSMIKVVVPRLQTRVIDRAMQVFGAMGLTPDTPLSFLWSWGRALQFIDGPDEVHLRGVARREIKAQASSEHDPYRYCTPPERLAEGGEGMTDPFDLKGKTALVTGASQGLGRRFAALLAERGASVALAARQVEKLDQLKAEIEQRCGTASAVGLDVTEAASIDSCLAEVEKTLGPLDILINNAGVAVSKSVLEQTEADWDKVVDTNLKGAFFMAQAAARQMAARGDGGTIVNIASVLALEVIGHLAPYAASKGGIWQVTKTMALELARHDIRVNALAPGYIVTDINRDFLEGEAGQQMVKKIPQRRFGEPEDLDGALLLLASDAGRYITGSVIVVDGGFMLQ